MSFVDRLSDLFGRLAAWMFFAVGGMITYEVVSRYVFLAPTIWAEELSQFFQIWATYLAAAYVLHHRQLISIDFAVTRMGPTGRRALEIFSLLFIAGFSAVAVYYGILIVADSVSLGRATSTMMGVPKWMTESAIPMGFGLLLLQALVEVARLLIGGKVPDHERPET